MSKRDTIAYPSPNFGPRAPDVPVDMLVLHYTGMSSSEAALARLCDPSAEVSAHYLVEEDGATYALVPESERAWHAGVACWRLADDINSRSIGIELVNPGHEFGYRGYPEAQMTALIDLSRAILARHPIPARNVVGHSDVAPARKRDPGELFDWRRLAGAGIGLWPEPVAASPEMIPVMLAAYGYDTGQNGVIAAFQRHFRPDRIDDEADSETASLLRGLVAMIEDG